MYLSSTLLAIAQEVIDTRELKSRSFFVAISTQYVAHSLLKRALSHVSEICETKLSEPMLRKQKLQFLLINLRLSYPTLIDPDTAQLLAYTDISSNPAGVFTGVLRGLAGMLDIVRIFSEIAVLFSMVSEDEINRTFAVISLLGFLLSNFERRGISRKFTKIMISFATTIELIVVSRTFRILEKDC